MERRLKKRREFLRVAQEGIYGSAATLVVQLMLADSDSSPASIGVGFTASRRVGGAVRRNRAKRRLREAVRRLIPLLDLPMCDIVVIAKSATVDAPFDYLLRDLKYAITKCLKEISSL
ncbi:ribonuclease P protein component [Candidatus Odyssella acanthamoebae]|uniref:ribonuclease P protein component n=1 Tax=Candidatus Odyssella acanthamoebae TaxID=91604 RepID=UPI00056E95EA|nr:ribonuclease P protein component [Candidatus Paracaedibacter acanthamoebae]